MVNPVLVNDLRKNLFRRKPVLATLYAALVILALTLGVSTLPFGGYGSQPLWFIPDLIVPMLAPAFAAGAFAKEHEQRTWQDVLLTRLTTWQILSGKFFACLVPTLVAIVVLLPPFALAMMVLSVHWALDSSPWPFALVLKLMVSAVFYLALTLLCSYYSANPRTALVVSYTLLAVYAISNYLLWTFILVPYFYAPVIDYSAYGNYQNSSHYWDRADTSLLLSPVEVIHLIQSCTLTVIIFIILAWKIRRGRA